METQRTSRTPLKTSPRIQKAQQCIWFRSVDTYSKVDYKPVKGNNPTFWKLWGAFTSSLLHMLKYSYIGQGTEHKFCQIKTLIVDLLKKRCRKLQVMFSALLVLVCVSIYLLCVFVFCSSSEEEVRALQSPSILKYCFLYELLRFVIFNSLVREIIFSRLKATSKPLRSTLRQLP